MAGAAKSKSTLLIPGPLSNGNSCSQSSLRSPLRLSNHEEDLDFLLNVTEKRDFHLCNSLFYAYSICNTYGARTEYGTTLFSVV